MPNAWYKPTTWGQETTYRRGPVEGSEFERYETYSGYGYRRKPAAQKKAKAKTRTESKTMDKEQSVVRYKGHTIYRQGEDWVTDVDPESRFESVAEAKRFLSHPLQKANRGGPPIRRTAKDALTLYDRGMSTAYKWTAGLPSRIGHSLLSNPISISTGDVVEYALSPGYMFTGTVERIEGDKAWIAVWTTGRYHGKRRGLAEVPLDKVIRVIRRSGATGVTREENPTPDELAESYEEHLGLTTSPEFLDADPDEQAAMMTGMDMAEAGMREHEHGPGCGCQQNPPRPVMLTVGKQMSLTPPHPADNYQLQGPWKFVPKYTSVRVQERGRGGHRFLVHGEYFGSPFWGWVEKDELQKYDPGDPDLRNNPEFGGESYKTRYSLPANTQEDEQRAEAITQELRKQGWASTFVYKENRSGVGRYDLYTNAMRKRVQIVERLLKNNPNLGIRGHHRTAGLWPTPGVIDGAITKRAEAMARTGHTYTSSESDQAADALINTLFGRNAEITQAERNHIRTLLWNTYQGYEPGYKGFHREAVAKQGRRRLKKLGYLENPPTRPGQDMPRWTINEFTNIVGTMRDGATVINRQTLEQIRKEFKKYGGLIVDVVNSAGKHVTYSLVVRTAKGKASIDELIAYQRGAMTGDFSEHDKFLKRNPESSADAMFESFHGYAPEQDTFIEEEEHFHENLAALGNLSGLEIITPTNLKVEITFEGNQPILCSNESGTQLFIEGGDQEINLNQLRMNTKKWLKELMVLGDIETITYDTEKTFDNREPVSYYHHFTEDEPGEPLPQLVYDTVNQKLSIVGGKYYIKQPLIGVSPGIEN